ncbi:MAG: S1 RNA-binding domain-containing protein [Oscillospiraceae bacterium]|nr:S1 RNA-binding domain-containing protein [Oscillospiraceae bacterium]
MAIEEGAILKGVISGLTGFGAFVDLGEGKRGMVHISEVANTYVQNIQDFVVEGQEVTVQVLTVSNNGKISLSIKRLQPELPPDTPPPRPKPPQLVWQGPRRKEIAPGDVDAMLSRFRQVSEEKCGELRRSTEAKRGGRGGRRGK